jgi:hypothetical protein
MVLWSGSENQAEYDDLRLQSTKKRAIKARKTIAPPVAGRKVTAFFLPLTS